MNAYFNADTYVPVLLRETHRPYTCTARTPEEVLSWQRAFRPKLREALGIPRIEARGPCALEPRVVGVEEVDGIIREDLRIQTEPGFELPFYLLRPARQSGPRPLVLTPHGHNHHGRKTYAGITVDDEDKADVLEGQRDIAWQAVKEGYVAIAPDTRAFQGTRMKADLEKDKLSSCRTLNMHAILFGRTLTAERVWDISRLIDYAQTRSEVDARRILITGNSTGGTTSLFAAACDERISMSIPGSYFCTFEASIAGVYHCECNYVPGLLALAEMYDVAGLIAPRPFLAVNGQTDPIFPIAAVHQSFAALKKIYEAAGAAERCRLFVGDGGHRYYKAPVWPFVKEFLG